MFEEILSNSSEVKNNNIETSAADAVNNSGLSGQKVLEIVYALINADEKIRNRLKIRPGKKSKYVIYDDKFALGFDGILEKMGEHVDLNLPVKQIIEQLPPDCKKDTTLTLAKAFNLLLDFDKNSFTEADKTYFISEFKNYHSKLRSLMEEYAKNNIDLHDLETFYAQFDVPKEINSAIDYFWDLAKKHPCSKEMINVKTTGKKSTL
ncbi:hypothetical protein SAMN02746089_02742 [Caldanaerobius fijiensis DSM 17918]|uniref:Uncharacterized protein n=1 Tax=Caldanaerobius fijiensis DSM 17918 TaxID=1121256 RepID=A0A1M5FEE6_9THEO|nr:hypothetical protein [Caldanaerobius fijiensis]SHF89927.1 hypothetical protein SAMN02746089_02742 [Caldanaerobius fijiensis DSM 17918]